MGMMPGEERTFDLTYPEDFDEEARRGKTATYHVKVSSISARKLPELDDEFAKSVAPVQSVEALPSSGLDPTLVFASTCCSSTKPRRCRWQTC